MTTSTLQVVDLFSVLGAQGIEKRLRLIAGVNTVSMNPISGTTTAGDRYEKDPDRHVQDAITLVFDKVQELGSARASIPVPTYVTREVGG